MKPDDHFWVDPDGPSFDFLKRCTNEREEAVRQREEAERKRKLAEEKQKRIEAELRHRLAEEQERRRREEERRQTLEAEQARRLDVSEGALARVSSEVELLRRQNHFVSNEVEYLRRQNHYLEEKMSKRIEILPPAAGIPALPQPEAELPQLDLAHFEDQIREAASTLDLKKPEGWLDKWFGRPDHRIRKKTERAQHLAGLVAATKEIIVEYQHAIESVAAVQRAKYQLFLDRLEAMLKMMEAQCRLELARRNVERQDAIEDAKARAEIARYEAEARESGLRGRPAPPPLPPPPPPAPVDEATRRKEAARQTRKEENDLALDELDEAAQFDQEKVSRARAEATKIYQNTHMLADERFDRIRRVLESYKVDVSVLPKAIREFMEEEGEADTI